MKKSLLFLVIIGFVAFIGCKKQETAEKSKINWFQGEMTEALAQAKKEDRPLFVYWGAAWCPPCNVLKATVFKDSSFVESTKKFISVYLDGDTEQAQEWGEKLFAAGYPTLMILNSQGKEVVRLSGGGTPQDVADAMNSAYDNVHPIDELVEKVLAQNPDEVSEKTWKLLAGYSWSQAKQYKDKINWIETYKKLEKRIPKKYSREKNEFFLTYLLALTDKEEKKKLSQKEIKALYKKFTPFLDNEELFRNSYMAMAYYPKDLAELFFAEDSEERQGFIKKYKAAMAKERGRKEKGSNEHLIGFYPLLSFAKLSGEGLAVLDKDMLKKEMLEALAAVKNPYQRVFVSSKASYILNEAGFYKEAKETLLDDIKKSKTPYYSMSTLAGIEKKKGNKKEALKWSEKAYNYSKGHATRLEWGSSYLRSMIKLAPTESDRILREVQKYYATHLKLPDAFMGRNGRVLKGLAKSLKKWQEEQKNKEINKKMSFLKSKWLGECKKSSKIRTENYRGSCVKYFEKFI